MIIIRIRINTGAMKECCWYDSQYKVVCSVKAHPIDGKANKALIALLSERLSVSKSAIQLTGGITTRYKTIAIETKLSLEEVISRLCGDTYGSI